MFRRWGLIAAVVAAGAFAAPASADAFKDQIVQQLAAQGFTEFRISRTFLGRTRVLAYSSDLQREIIYNPATGVILRDFWRDREDDRTRVAGSDGRSNSGGSGNASPSASSSGSGENTNPATAVASDTDRPRGGDPKSAGSLIASDETPPQGTSGNLSDSLSSDTPTTAAIIDPSAPASDADTPVSSDGGSEPPGGASGSGGADSSPPSSGSDDNGGSSGGGSDDDGGSGGDSGGGSDGGGDSSDDAE
jgi:hypothetical protein